MGKHHSKFGFDDPSKNSKVLPGMICFPARLRRANSVDSFVVPLLPAAQSALSVATTSNGRSLSLESIPLLDTVPLLRAEEQPSIVTSNLFSSSLPDHEHSDTTSTDSSLSETEKESEKKESTTSVATEEAIQGSQHSVPFFNLSEQEWKDFVDYVCNRVESTLRTALLEKYQTQQYQQQVTRNVNKTRNKERHSHPKLRMSERDAEQFDELLQKRLQQVAQSCFRDKEEVGKTTKRTTSRPRRSNSHHSSAPLTPSLSRRKHEWYLSGRSKSEEDTSRCGRQCDEDFQSRLEEIAKQCNSRGIRGKGITMNDGAAEAPKLFTPVRQRQGQKKVHSKSLADQLDKSIDNNAPGIPENRHNRSKAKWKSHSMGRDYASKYPNGRPFVVQHKEAEIQPVSSMIQPVNSMIQPVNSTVQVQQEVHYYHEHFEVGTSANGTNATCDKFFSHSRTGAHHDCTCYPNNSGRLSPQTDMAVCNFDHKPYVRHFHRHDHHHFHILHVSKRTQV